jgi:hypothetical protein
MKIYDEIKKIGFTDWVWWVFYCNRNEFHPRLNLNLKECIKSKEHHINETKRVCRERQKAHDIDMRLS